MLHSNVPKNEQGFTLLEIIVVLVIISVLAAISAPSLLGMYNRSKLNQAQTNLRGIINQSQRNAIRRSANCTVTLPASGEDRTISSTCASSVFLDRATMTHDSGSSPITITFNFRGETTTNIGAIRLSVPNVSEQKCLVVSTPLGLTRVGDFDGTNCITNQF